ncbi:TPA: KH domain-containing protein [Candidatus Woesearchaeota archaeon]|nr:KH domain-containing protein [Candidatus Woesearchaeota archaeon]HIH31543.1 KH domain-containing protein [Candidatus Woesearchaeota archaeon]HIH54299.1 KH domain-containing protein [Candidatus Woesearchaeota archaeon]HIJ02511.1 KH domain-containing protein [Candidatus Woesearchaeota archaeon]HIJ13443.1 KH domain-containing protein [Candidatus Woesearchaeota archaeon]
MSILVKDKEVVVPGEALADDLGFIPGYGTYRFNNKLLASRLGLVNIEGKVIKTIPLAGKYLPKRNDVVIGRVIDILISGWRCDINSPYTAVLSSKETPEFIEKNDDLSRYFDLDDYVVAKITNVTSQNLIDLTVRDQGLRKLRGGRIISVNTHKVPRIIGKKGSMVTMIKQATNCRIIVGQNGWIYVDGEPQNENIAVLAINKIASESHLSGLTERIKEFLEKETGVKINLEDKGDYNGLQ